MGELMYHMLTGQMCGLSGHAAFTRRHSCRRSRFISRT